MKTILNEISGKLVRHHWFGSRVGTLPSGSPGKTAGVGQELLASAGVNQHRSASFMGPQQHSPAQILALLLLMSHSLTKYL